MKRYSKDPYCRCSMEPGASGAWVMFDDIEPLQRDADRYRWLAGNGWAEPALYVTGPREWGANGAALLAGPHLDAAIDAVMAEDQAATDKDSLFYRLPPGFEASRNENGSITVTNDQHSIIAEANAASARQAPEEMLHALLVALGA